MSCMEHNGSPVELGTGNIRRLLLKYAIPSVIAMTASSLYNITDSIFIGHGVGALAISGLAITFPLMNISAAFGSLVGVGASTLMSLRLGQKDYDSAKDILGNVFVLNTIFGLLYTIIVLLFLDKILYFFGASEETLPYAHDFMVVISLCNIITHLYFGLNAMLRATGHPKKSMYTTLFSVLINIMLAPVFIFVFKWGIRGAALATMIAQTSMLMWQIIHFTNRNNFIHLQRGSLRLKRKIVFESLSIGMAPFLMNSVASVIVIVINTSLIRYGGDLAVGAYGIINRITFLFIMVVLGLNQGMQPIAGYNFGARQYGRVNDVLKSTIILATSIMMAGFVIGELFPKAVASVFTSDKELIDIIVPGMRIVMLSFPIAGFQMVTSSFFQSIGMPVKSIFMSMSRQVLFLLPCLLILPPLFGVKGVWYSMPTSDIIAGIVAAYLLIIQYRKNKLSENDQNI